eukprot:CAMPEP_0185304686 /NCGR_PEP_ID=MMETSP1363-20130426/14910_1 /TAXON_ID=38817 /ORGANISM="Gephyrocapsa oceanica, Strain RCC1303" /LENGTH=82 /DNA_ID=CAMNT_0027901889 /DNA_START=3 /DNA_END=248 /DNA_ORIENTATION=-
MKAHSQKKREDGAAALELPPLACEADFALLCSLRRFSAAMYSARGRGTVGIFTNTAPSLDEAAIGPLLPAVATGGVCAPRRA